MVRSRFSRLTVELLEQRWCPTVSAEVIDGSLFIWGDEPARLGLTQIDEHAFRVVDSGVVVGEFGGVTHDVVVLLGDGDDRVRVNLEHHTTPGDLVVGLGNGNNSVTIQHGTVGGSLHVRGGDGVDNIVLGSDPNLLSPVSPAFAVEGDTTVEAGASRGDRLKIQPHVVLHGDLHAVSANNFGMAAGS